MSCARRCRAPRAAHARARARPAHRAPLGRREIPSSPRTPCRVVVARAESGRRAAGSLPPLPQSLLAVPAGPVAGELVGDAATARATLQRPLQLLLARAVAPLGA